MEGYSFITLTTDLGDKDFYIPSVKGYIYKRLSSINIVDITNKISPFNPIEAAFILRNSYLDFPEGTIHIVSIESNQVMNDDYIMVEFNKHYFLAHNNGIISLITDGKSDKIIKLKLNHNESVLFPLKNILAEAACQFVIKKNVSALGEEIKEMESVTNLNPILEQDMIRGTIIYIDNYGNAISNILKSHIERYDKTKKLLIQFSGKHSIDRISNHYSDVPEGSALCFFGVTGLLEIAVNRGNAAQLFGLSVKSRIIIEFV